MVIGCATCTVTLHLLPDIGEQIVVALHALQASCWREHRELHCVRPLCLLY